MTDMKKLITDYDEMNRIIGNTRNLPNHREILIRMINLFKKKHSHFGTPPERLDLVEDLSRRLNEKLNGSII
jgi:hypothetical protein